MTEQKIWDLIKRLTLEEKAALVNGSDMWNTKAFKNSGIPALKMADGPHGLRIERKERGKDNGYYSNEATCFPSESSLANSFSVSLVKKIGGAIAEECIENGVGLILAPGINVKRSPLGGRNFEYYSEDPVVSGLLGAAFISGVQEKGVGACIKHFTANNQETKRMSINTIVDERALFEIYLKPFDIAVKAASPAAVMASYNKVNGEYVSENRYLLTDVLRLLMGFRGVVISDWGAVNTRHRAIMAGLDLEMPSSASLNTNAILKAIKDGMLLETSLDTACFNLLRIVFEYSRSGKEHTASSHAAHHELCVEALSKSTVLLKNDGLLPLKITARLAVIGELAQNPRIQGGGSSLVNPKNLSSFTRALTDKSIEYVYSRGYEKYSARETLFDEAVENAKNAEAVIYFMGLPDTDECEGFDRESLRLPQVQLDLLQKLCDANENICVVLISGGPVETPWLGRVKSVLYPGLGGEGFGEALLQLIFGVKSPSGKLAETWPVSIESTPSYKYFPMGPANVTYNESIYVGYRYYEKVKQTVLFGFGHGLSYTSFDIYNMALSHDTLPVGRSLMAHLTVENTGKADGDEIIFIYTANPGSKFHGPLRELKAFSRVSLKSGEKKNIQIKIPYEAFGIYDVENKCYVVESGAYDIIACQGPGSHVLKQEIKVRGKSIISLPEKQYGVKSYYGGIKNNLFPDSEFEKLFPCPPVREESPSFGSYKMTTTLGEMQDSKTGRKLLKLVEFFSSRFIHFGESKDLTRHVSVKLAQDMPFKNLMMNSRGIIGPKAGKTLLDICNGKKAYPKLIKQLITRV